MISPETQKYINTTDYTDQYFDMLWRNCMSKEECEDGNNYHFLSDTQAGKEFHSDMPKHVLKVVST